MSETNPSGRRQPARRRPGNAPTPPATTGSIVPDVSIDEERAASRAERQISLIFLLSAACTVMFVVGYVVFTFNHSDDAIKVIHSVQLSNMWLGTTLGLALTFLGIGTVLWAKKLMTYHNMVTPRDVPRSTDEAREETIETFRVANDESGIPRRKLLRRTLGLSMGLLAVPPIFLLRDLGPLPKKTLRKTAWYKDARLIDISTGLPVKLGDVRVGGIVNVMPERKDAPADASGGEGVGEDHLFVEPIDAATSPTILIRLRPGENRPKPGRANWAADAHVAYSKICTHAGCPIGLYEQQTHQLFCPCHQSTFDVLDGCRVVFGPAARPLPQLPIYVDDDGYFRARSDYKEPVGPSFWERG
jgi:ubiquinol-cytochrome c reductase iron-sulfur subunit